MPSNFMHLYTGYVFAVKSGIVTNKPLFYLGCIAPDRVNVDGFAPKEIRVTAHHRDKDLKIWQENVKEYLHYSGLPMDFKLGLCLHCVTDIAWDEFFDAPFYEQMREKGVKEDFLKDQRWLEMYSFDKSQLDEAWLNDEVLPALKQGDCSVFDGEFFQMNRHRNNVVNDYRSEIVFSEYRLIDKAMVDKLAAKSIQKMAAIV